MGDERLYQPTKEKESVQAPARKKALPPLPQEEIDKIERRKALIDQHMPELVPFFRECVRTSMLDSWRSLVKVEIYETGEVV